MHIRAITVSDAASVAQLHSEGIQTGFLTSLGPDFLAALYRSIVAAKGSFGLVAEEDGQVVAYVAFTTGLKELYKNVILTGGLTLASLLVLRVLSFNRLKHVFQTLLYPARTKNFDLPDAELLAIVVSDKARGRGIATKLLRKGLETCREVKINKVKVLVAADNTAANYLYKKTGFTLATQFNSHGILSNIYVADTSSS